MTNLIFWGIVYVFTGAIMQAADAKHGVSIYKWYYAFTHEHPLDNDVRSGFIFNRPVRTRVGMAATLSMAKSLIALSFGANSLTELFMFFLGTIGISVGFNCGPFLQSIWNKKEDAFSAIEKVEKEGISFRNKAPQSEMVQPIETAEMEDKQESAEKPPTTQEASQDKNPEEAMNTFINKYK